MRAKTDVSHGGLSPRGTELRKATGPLVEESDRRTEFAADRTVFAAERTYAAWVRTGLASLASGVGAKALLAGVLSLDVAKLVASVLILFSACCFAAAVWRDVMPVVTRPQPDVRRIPPALLYSVNGILVLVALAALVSIWVRAS